MSCSENRQECSEDASLQRPEENAETLASFLEEFLVEEEDEQVDVYLGLIEHLHHRYALILQLQQVL